MVFKNNIPQPTDNLSDSQGDLLNNNAQLDTSFGINHYTFSDLTVNNGKHKFTTFVAQAAKPVLAGTDVALYSKLVSGVNQLFYEDSAATEYQISGSLITSGATPNFSGECPLFGGLSIKWGFISTVALTPQTVSYATFSLSNFTSGTYVVLLQTKTITGSTANQLGNITAKTTTGFTLAPFLTATVDWFVIGK